MSVLNYITNTKIVYTFSDISRLSPIKEQLPEHVDFNHIKIVIAILQYQFGVRGDCLENNDNSMLRSQSSVTKVRSFSLTLSLSLSVRIILNDNLSYINVMVKPLPFSN